MSCVSEIQRQFLDFPEIFRFQRTGDVFLPSEKFSREMFDSPENFPDFGYEFLVPCPKGFVQLLLQMANQFARLLRGFQKEPGIIRTSPSFLRVPSHPDVVDMFAQHAWYHFAFRIGRIGEAFLVARSLAGVPEPLSK